MTTGSLHYRMEHCISEEAGENTVSSKWHQLTSYASEIKVVSSFMQAPWSFIADPQSTFKVIVRRFKVVFWCLEWECCTFRFMKIHSNPPILYYGINNHDLWPLRWRWCWQQGCAGSFGGSASSLPDWLAHRRMVWKVQQDNILALVSRDDYLANRYSLLCKHETESVGLGNCNSSLHPYLDNSPPGQFPTV